MNYLALDLELNQPSGKIIEIGVVIGNRTDGVIDEMSWLIDPIESIDESIVELTGINDDLIVERGVSLGYAAAELSAMIVKHSCFVNPVQWGHGDAELLKSELRLAGIDFPHFGRRTIDVKTICTFLSKAVGRKPNGGLKSHVERYGLVFLGQAHRACFDARATLELFFELLRRQQIMEERPCNTKPLR